MAQRLCRGDGTSVSKCTVPTNQRQCPYSCIPFYLNFLWVDGYSCTWSHSVTHTHTHTLGRSPLVEGSAIAKVQHARLRGHKYLCPCWGSNTQLQQARDHRALDRAATAIRNGIILTEATDNAQWRRQKYAVFRVVPVTVKTIVTACEKCPSRAHRT